MARTLLTMLLMCLAAASCGSADAPSNTAELQRDSELNEPAGSPMEAEVGFSSDPSRRNEQFITMQRRANEQVVACMSAVGFEYFAQPIERSRLLGPRAGAGTRDWTSVNGLGITTSLLELTEGSSRTRTSLDATAANAAYTAQLSVEQSQRYDAALIGAVGPDAVTGPGDDAVPNSVNDARSPGEFAPAGCWGAAYGDFIKQLRLADQLATELVLLNDRVRADPRMRGFMSEWSSCMSDQGHRYPDREALLDDFFARSLTIEITETEAGAALVDPAAFDQLLATEISVALDDLGCREPLANKITDLRNVYERELLADNRAAIAATLQSGP